MNTKQRKPMTEVIAEARKRRAQYLHEYNSAEDKLGMIYLLSKKHNLSAARMGQLIKHAKEEA